jgi:hypothetical protein
LERTPKGAGGEIHFHPDCLGEAGVPVRQIAQLARAVRGFFPGCHDEGVIDRNHCDIVYALGENGVAVFQIARQMVEMAGGRESARNRKHDNLFAAKQLAALHFGHSVGGGFLESCLWQCVPNSNRHVGAPFCAVDVVCNLGNAAGISSLAARENVEGA